MLTSQLIRDIRSLSIQGAENIIKACLLHLKEQSASCSYSRLQTIAHQLLQTRPTEPGLKNSFRFLFSQTKTAEEVGIYAETALREFSKADEVIATHIFKKIPKNSTVYTHCHSSTVTRGIIKAKQKKIQAFCTETRPRYQGRITAKELSSSGIKTTQFVDSGAYLALKHADVCLLGADAITGKGVVVNKIGSGMIGRLCHDLHVPLYICTHSWKFDPATLNGEKEVIEERESKEVWNTKQKHLSIRNPAFEEIDPHYITGIISELGVLPPKIFISEMKHHYPWMFTS